MRLFLLAIRPRAFAHQPPTIKKQVGPVGLEPTTYHSGKTTLRTQDDAESDADSTGLDAVVESWGLLTADDRRRIIAIVNGRLASREAGSLENRPLDAQPKGR